MNRLGAKRKALLVSSSPAPSQPQRGTGSRSKHSTDKRRRRSPTPDPEDDDDEDSELDQLDGHDNHEEDQLDQDDSEDERSVRPPAKRSKNGSSARATKKPKKVRTAAKQPDLDSELKKLLTGKGRIVGRVVNMFARLPTILDVGARRWPDDDDSKFKPMLNKYYGQFLVIMELIPSVLDIMAELGPNGSRLIGDVLKSGRAGARGTDIISVKKAIPFWRGFHPPLDVTKRHTWGFKHPTCLRLLFPSTKDLNDVKLRDGLRDGSIAAQPTDFPLLLFLDELVNADDLFDGWLRGELLVKCFLHIFRAPSAATSDNQQIKSKGDGNAGTHDISCVTIEAIAYVAVIVRFVLSSQLSFSEGGTAGKWPYVQFYNAIIDTTVNEMDEEDQQELLEWWNAKIFGDILGQVVNDDEEDDAESTAMAKMKAQSAARRLAKEQAAQVLAEQKRAAKEQATKEQEAAVMAVDGVVPAVAVEGAVPVASTSANPATVSCPSVLGDRTNCNA